MEGMEELFSSYGVIGDPSVVSPPEGVLRPRYQTSSVGNVLWERYISYTTPDLWARIPTRSKRDANRLRNVASSAAKHRHTRIHTRVREMDDGTAILWLRIK